MKKIAMAVLLSAMVLPAASFGATVIRVAPPRAVVEHYGAPPHRGYVWTPGYQNWVGGRYVWVPGSWARPPRAGAVWVPHRWVRRHGTWVIVGGHWR